jgi:OFA family oxalate/formate antiporter-like MFS transporter
MPPSNSGRATANRWVQLIVGIACMVMIANLQYGWTLFVHPMREKFGWDRSAIQVAFTIFVLVETGVVPFEGWIVDRFGPKRVVLAGGVLVGLAWGLNSIADSLPLLYLGAVLGGIGAGGVFGTCIGNALKWFPDRRGLAAGLTAAGYGLGSAFTIVPIQRTIEAHGYQAAFLWFGIAQGVIVCLASLMLEAPRDGQAPVPSARLQPSTRDFAPKEVLRSPLFWLLYVMFVLVSAGGLTFTAQLAPIAIDFDVAGVPVSLLGMTLPALTFALTIDRVTNGLTRPLCGWVSDHIGRETTMFIAFALEAVGIWALGTWGHDPLMFVLLGGVVFFAWGEVASLFPATCTDYYGTRYATTNAGLLYTAKGIASLLVPLASLLAAAMGHWHVVFVIAVLMNAVAAVLAIAVLRPLRLALGPGRAGSRQCGGRRQRGLGIAVRLWQKDGKKQPSQ